MNGNKSCEKDFPLNEKNALSEKGYSKVKEFIKGSTNSNLFESEKYAGLYKAAQAKVIITNELEKSKKKILKNGKVIHLNKSAEKTSNLAKPRLSEAFMKERNSLNCYVETRERSISIMKSQFY